MNQTNSYNFAQVVPEVLASGLPVSLCDIQEPSGLLTEDGSPDRTWVPVAGLSGLRCMNAPTSISSIQASERKSQTDTESDNSNHAWLAGFYPQIQTNWRAVIDGINYDITGVEVDSQSKQTRLGVQIAQV